MRLRPALLLGLYGAIIVLPTAIFGYTITLLDSFKDGAIIFDASIGQCDYQLKDISCSNLQFLFSIDDRGEIRALRYFYKSESSQDAVNSCTFVVDVKKCKNFHKSEFKIPINVQILPRNDLVMSASHMPPINISVTSEAQKSNISFGDLIDDVTNALSLAECDTRTEVLEKKLKGRGKHLTFCEKQIRNITLIQSIKNCKLNPRVDAAVPDQDVLINVKVGLNDCVELPQYENLLSMPDLPVRNIPKRRKRSFRNRFSFTPTVKRVDIAENQKPGTEVVALKLNNPSNVPVVYTWVTSSDKRSMNLFSLNDRTGVVKTTEVLNRENMASHSFRVTARSTSGSGQSASCSLIIAVLDMNDNDPIFEKSSYEFHVEEDEYVKSYVGKVTASDKDAGVNKQIRYSINGLQPPDVFEISNDGEITLGGEIDREKKAKYDFTVVAVDGGTPPKRSTTKVSVIIDDVNDVTPRFSQKDYRVQINEDTKKNVNIKKVTAVDTDAGENGKITYSLMTASDKKMFRINPVTGEISVIADINFKSHPTGIRLRVKAQDGGRPSPKFSICTVLVSIVDVNDNAPKFIKLSSYRKKVDEDEKIGYEVVQVKAVDADAGENARITYSFVESILDLPFRINNTSGRVTVSRKLDYEKAKAYHLTVKAMDHGIPRKSSTIGLDITIQNVNDNKPRFTLPVYRTRVNEDRDLGAEVIKVTAKDADEDANLHYRIISGNTYDKFDIGDVNNIGVISIAQRLDFNQKKSYILTVLCSDGKLSSTAQVRINVTDANTHIPEFDKSSYETTVLENVDVGDVIETVHATDGDVGENAKITYILQSKSTLFSLDSKTGEIKTKAKLDYDTMPQHYLTVVAKDSGVPPQQTEALVTIYLEDVNDNAPVFSQPKYSALVSEEASVQTSVTRIEAEDKDSGKNGQVVYTFDGGDNGNGDFKIDQSSGVIRVAVGLDREHIPEYRLIAYASDRGSPPKRTPVTILVTVTDVDDNPPQFASDELQFDVREDSPVGSIVAKLKAVDPDEDGDKIIYEIAMGAGDDVLDQWDLNYSTGELSPILKLDYETKSKYTLIVSAYSGQLLSQVKVIINLIDVNDNPPVLNDFQIIFNNYRTQKPYTFPFGPIGKIPAHDPDATSVLRYRFTSGNNTLLILNETTGELRLSSKLDNDREFTAPFKVEVSDGKYSVTGNCILKVVPITDEMLTNSVTVRVEEMSQENFLSNAMKQFIHGLGQILNVSTQDVYIFNVQNDTDVTPHAVVNVSFSARHPAGYYFTTQHLQEQVYLNRSLLTNYSMQNVMPFDDNICLREPCENYMRCVSALYFNSSAPFVSTQTVLFRPIHPVSGLRCKCPAGFAGHGCENEVNLCHANRCKNNGQCVSVEGGYVCTCNSTFTGRHCEVNMVGSDCEAAKDICKNGAKCHQYPAGGFRCECTQGGLITDELTPFCELRGRSFQKGDFAMFSGITRQWRFTLSLSFATREKSGLLLYNGRFNHEHDYLALEIVDGQVQLNFSTGQNYTVVSPYLHGGVNDGAWHTVLIEYRNKPNFEVFGRGHTGPSNVKVVTLTIDPDTCDPAISAKWRSSFGDYTCSKTVEQGGTKSSLDLTTPLLIGGVPKLPEAYQVRSRHFVGCIRDLDIDHRRVDMSHLVTNHGSQPGCRALRNHCSGSPCSSGTCTNTYGTYKCKCDNDHGGKRCERIQPVHRFQGVGCLKHQQVSLLPKPTTMPWTHAFSIRTTQKTGTLIYMKVNGGLEIEMSLLAGKVAYSVQISRNKYTDQVETVVNDGEWHEIVVEWRKYGRNIQMKIKIDAEIEQDPLIIRSVPSSLLNPSTTARITELYLGGRWSGSRVTNAFIGCIRGLEFTSQGQIHDVQEVSLQKTRNARVSKGCSVPDPCRSAKCPTNSDCVSNFDTQQCKCHKGYVGENCNSACVLNPCRDGSKCSLKSSKPYGYECQCSKPVYYGRTCHLEHIQPCPSGWHGYPICTPCNCPVERNFDPDCKNHKGVCKCKKNYYFHTLENMCLPCNCYHVGSIGLNCSNEVGQCKCKPGVTGKQCNKCSSKFAEVTDSGCRVLYNECPQAMENGIMWRRAKFGDTTPAQCPKDATGIATRICTKESGWLDARLGNCTSIPYHDLTKDLRDLVDNPDYLTEHSVRAALDAAKRLFGASNTTGKLYQGDVLMSYKMLTNILEMQKSLSEFDLAASRGADFNDYLIDSASHALASENLEHWKALQSDPRYKGSGKNSLSSAKLLRDFEEYAATLTSNMKSIYYNSISSTSQNLKLRIQSASNLKEERINLSGNSSVSGERNLVSIVLPPQKNTGSNVPADSTIGVIEFSTLGSVLPMSFHDSRLDMRIPQKPFINSAVVTVVTHHRVNSTTRSSQELIVLTFALLQDDGSDPQCVFWNFTARNGEGLGGWSQKGCTIKKSNKTHVTCACSHLTSFAVVSDEEVVSVLEELPVKIMLYASVVIILVCVSICFGFSCFLEDVKSNYAKIHSNFAISIFFSELCFAVGIMQTANAFVCMAVAIFIHFFFMSTFAWVVVEGLHLYRMLKEKKDVNRGNMRVYYLFGWGIPAIITALSVGLDAKGFGNANFCWITLDHLLVWSFIGPLLVCTMIYMLLFFMTIGEYLTTNLPETKRFDTKWNIKSSFILLPFVAALWVFALFAVNENKAVFYFMFSLMNVCLGVLLILLHCVFNKEVRDALRNVKERRWQRRELNSTKQILLSNSVYTPNTSNGHRRVNMLTGTSSTSTTNTANRRNNHQDSSMFHDLGDVQSDDSDSDISDSSISLASTHSSDEEAVEERPTYLNMNNSSNWPHKNGHLPNRKPTRDRLVVHSTPKDNSDNKDHENNYQPPSRNGSASSKNDGGSYKSSLPTVSEANIEQEQIEEPHYLAINSLQKNNGKVKSEEEHEMIPLQDMDSLPKKGILKNGRRSKPPTPVRVDSLRTHSPIHQFDTDETSLLKKRDTLEKVKVIRNSPCPSQEEQML